MKKLQKFLSTYKNKSIGLHELEQFGEKYYDSYDDFSKVVLDLESDGILTMVKSKGRTNRNPSIAFQYRINKSMLSEDFHLELQRYRSLFHSLINLDFYYGKDPSYWKKDLPYLQKIDCYLKHTTLPSETVPAPERSYELVGDEKWIVEKSGKEVLERIQLFDKLKIIPVSEPLMFAINPGKLNSPDQLHFIVENKTSYQGLLPVIEETDFSTLIYGCGKAVIKSIEQFAMQFPVQANHQFFYFGDLDREGITIWHLLNQKLKVELAIPFYQACLQKEPAVGKEYQRENKDAMDQFLSFFSNEEMSMIHRILDNGKYLPQETLKTKELQKIWRDSNWTSSN
ncbi:DUF2220 family protein [Bacillaceae bacterium S4-13-56]